MATKLQLEAAVRECRKFDTRLITQTPDDVFPGLCMEPRLRPPRHQALGQSWRVEIYRLLIRHSGREWKAFQQIDDDVWTRRSTAGLEQLTQREHHKGQEPSALGQGIRAKIKTEGNLPSQSMSRVRQL